jgi:uncharacterized protein
MTAQTQQSNDDDLCKPLALKLSVVPHISRAMTKCREWPAPDLRIVAGAPVSLTRTVLLMAPLTVLAQTADHATFGIGGPLMKHQAEELRIALDPSLSVSGLLLRPSRATACYVFAHGAGAGMTHPFMASVAGGLCDRGVATLRYQFPYMEKGTRRPDPPALAHATVRAAVAEARRLCPDMVLLAGGKSYGGRMTSQAQAVQPLPGVQALVFFGFPLHPAGKPSIERAHHLSRIHVPMLFIQGTRDKLAEPALIADVVEKLGPNSTMQEIDGADHSLHVPAKSGRRDAEVLSEAMDSLVRWSASITPKAAVRAS